MSNQNTDANQSLGAAEKPLNRRKLLKVAVATAPFIATLPSGAALARSSNLISATSAGAATDLKRRTLCLDLTSGTGEFANGGLDLGAPPSGKLTAINDRKWFTKANAGSAPATEAEMCQQGGTYYYLDGGWNQATLPKGILVSATALSSFAGSIYTHEI